MPDVPLLPVAGDGLPPRPDALRAWAETLSATVDEVVVDPLPDRNGNLPDLVQACGLKGLSTAQRLPAHAGTWIGQGGARIQVNGGGSATWQGQVGEHTGSDHPAFVGEEDRIAAAAEVAGVEAGPDGTAIAWNPVALGRRCLVSFPAGDHHPWALRDPRTGARHPLQVCEGIDGPELLCSLPLAALEARTYEASDEPVPGGSPWEVSAEILDNGLVRAEIDLYGRIDRLCFAGRFVDLDGPLLQAGCDDQVLAVTPARIQVIEDGPVRARVQATIETARGVVHLIYTLQAFDPSLRITVAWDGTPPQAWLDLSTRNLRRPHWRSNGYAAEALSTSAGMATWLHCDDGQGGGLGIGGLHPLHLTVAKGACRLGVRPGLGFALSDPHLVDPALLAETCLVRGIGTAGSIPAPCPTTLVGLEGVARPWARRCPDGSGEILLVEQHGRRSRGWLRGTGSRAWLCDLRGRPLRDLARTPEDDAWQVDLTAGGIACLRWR